MGKLADKKGVTIIGPATVGGVKPGCFKIGNTGGMMDNILHSKLCRPGSVAYVSRSGGMSNELNNMISQTTNGVHEGVAIGGDRYPCSTFMDHLIRYQNDPEVGMLVLLGEVGGTEEYRVCEAIKSGVLSKPIVAWCIGTCADMFTTDVQFGHAWASAGAQEETATSKNSALKVAGAEVPSSFDELGETIARVYADLVMKGVIVPKPEVPPPPVPMDYNWARELGLIRKPASFMSSISDERGHGHWWGPWPALVPAQASPLRLQVPRNVPDDHGGPRTSSFWCSQYNCLCKGWQGSCLLPRLWSSHHRRQIWRRAR